MEFTKPTKQPWLLRVCPERHRRKLTTLGRLIGIAGYFVWFFGGLIVVIFGPFKFAMMEPDAPISRPIIWLARNVGTGAFCIIYFSVMLAVAFILLWGIQVYEYSHSPKPPDQGNP
jgi:hypothetical protein